MDGASVAHLYGVGAQHAVPLAGLARDGKGAPGAMMLVLLGRTIIIVLARRMQ